MFYRLLIGTVISLTCLALALRGVPLRSAWVALQHAHWGWLVWAACIYAGSFTIRAIRWSILMRPLKRVSPWALLGPLILGFFGNNILPLRMGELVRAHFSGRKLQLSRASTLATIVLERLCDSACFVGIFFLAALFSPFPPLIKKAAVLMALVCATALVLLILTMRQHAFILRWIQNRNLSPVWKLRLAHFVEHTAAGLAGLRDRNVWGWVLPLSGLLWSFEVSVLYVLCRAYPPGITFGQTFFLQFFLGLSVALPQAPGYVGTIEFFGVTALASLGIPRETGFPMIVTIHLFQFLYLAMAGLWALTHEGLTIYQLVHTSDQEGKISIS